MELKQPPWDVGDEVVVFVAFADAALVPANPIELILQIGRKNGTVLHTFKKSLGQLDNPAPGDWEKHYVIEEPGLQVSWDATGTVTIVKQGAIETMARILPRPV